MQSLYIFKIIFYDESLSHLLILIYTCLTAPTKYVQIYRNVRFASILKKNNYNKSLVNQNFQNCLNFSRKLSARKKNLWNPFLFIDVRKMLCNNELVFRLCSSNKWYITNFEIMIIDAMNLECKTLEPQGEFYCRTYIKWP